ncbi:hypothetical protein OAB00_01020 [Akkermansiaceae bacterium]|nr:hypothetical protein [Akkermansiaceae bacterium]
MKKLITYFWIYLYSIIQVSAAIDKPLSKVIEAVNWDKKPIEEIVKFIEEEHLDDGSDLKMEFVIHAKIWSTIKNNEVTLNLKNIPLSELIEQVFLQSEYQVEFSQKSIIVSSPAGEARYLVFLTTPILNDLPANGDTMEFRLWEWLGKIKVGHFKNAGIQVLEENKGFLFTIYLEDEKKLKNYIYNLESEFYKTKTNDGSR